MQEFQGPLSPRALTRPVERKDAEALYAAALSDPWLCIPWQDKPRKEVMFGTVAGAL